MEGIIAWWARNPVAANLLMAGIMLGGVLGFISMEREAFPAFNIKQVQIEVIWPGAAPQEVEEQVVMRIEEALTNLDSVRRISATASEGYGRVDVAAYSYVDINAFVNDVKNRVDAVNGLPRDIEKPQVKRTEYRDEMIRVALHGNVSEKALTRLAQDLRDQIAALPYVSIVNLYGTRREEVTVELSEASMRSFGVSFAEVAQAIRSSSINLSSGQVRTATGDIRLRARNLADSQADFENIIVRQTAGGATVRVGDLATVIDGFEENKILTTMNGQPAVLLDLLATDNMQVVKASEAVKTWLAQTRPTLPQGVNLTLWFDTAEIYKSRMSTIGDSAYVGLLLVFLVLILSLRPKVALWVTAGIAVAFIGTFSLLPANDVSLNVMSTFAFLLVLGIVVDDAIVVGESIHLHAHRHGGGTEAAIAGASAVSKPVIFAVITTMIAFAPWFFLDVEGGHMTEQFSMAHLRHLKPRENLRGLSLWQRRIEHSIMHFADTYYRRILRWTARRRYLTSSIFIGAFIVSVGIFSAGWVKFSFFPEIQNQQIYINVMLPNGTPYSRSLEVLDQLQRAELQLIEEVGSGSTGAGEKLIQGWYARASRDSVIAIVRLTPQEQRTMSAREVAQRLQDLVGDIPDADEIEVNYTINRRGPAITYMLRHRDMDMLRAASGELQSQLRSYEGAYYVRDSLRGESDEIHLKLLPGATRLGINLAQVSQQVRQAYYGEEVQRLPRENGDVKVMVKYPRALRESLSSLNDFRVRTADGRELPLLSVVAIEVNNGVQRIQRRDGERMVRVTAEAAVDQASDIYTDLERELIPQLQLQYPELTILRGGIQETQEEFFSEIIALYAVAFFMMYALIAVAFHSYWLPLLIMTAIPFGFMGAIFGHTLFAMPMALFSYFGIGAAAGVVVNDNLVLVDYMGRLRAQGKGALEAVIEAGVQRFRPIVLTTVTTFVGLIPIMAEQSIDAQFLKPAVLSLAFGVLFALFVTLLMVPALYLIGQDCDALRSRLLARFKSSQAEPQTPR
jgi:multidrug efflux pump subunit AcrB